MKRLLGIGLALGLGLLGARAEESPEVLFKIDWMPVPPPVEVVHRADPVHPTASSAPASPVPAEVVLPVPLPMTQPGPIMPEVTLVAPDVQPMLVSRPFLGKIALDADGSSILTVVRAVDGGNSVSLAEFDPLAIKGASYAVVGEVSYRMGGYAWLYVLDQFANPSGAPGAIHKRASSTGAEKGLSARFQGISDWRPFEVPLAAVAGQDSPKQVQTLEISLEWGSGAGEVSLRHVRVIRIPDRVGGPPLDGLAPQRQLLPIDQAIENGLKMENEKRYAASREAFQSAIDQLNALKKAAPDWEPDVVDYRIKMARDKLDWMMDKQDAAPSAVAVGHPPISEVVIEFTKSGLRLEGKEVDENAVIARLQALQESGADLQVLLRNYAGGPYARVSQMVEALAKIGIQASYAERREKEVPVTGARTIWSVRPEGPRQGPRVSLIVTPAPHFASPGITTHFTEWTVEAREAVFKLSGQSPRQAEGDYLTINDPGVTASRYALVGEWRAEKAQPSDRLEMLSYFQDPREANRRYERGSRFSLASAGADDASGGWKPFLLPYRRDWSDPAPQVLVLRIQATEPATYYLRNMRLVEYPEASRRWGIGPMAAPWMVGVFVGLGGLGVTIAVVAWRAGRRRRELRRIASRDAH